MVAACATGNTLRRDHQKSPLDSNYHSALIKTPLKTFYGVGVAQADLGQPFTFSVQGIHQGTIHVTSPMCGVDESRYYSDSEEVSFTVTLTGERCLFGITVMPQFSIEESDGIEWRGLSGVLLLRRSYRSMNLHVVRELRTRRIRLAPQVNFKSRMVLRGCGLLFDQVVAATPSITLPPSGIEGDCVVEGFIQNEFESQVMVYYVSRFSPQFSKLAPPKIKFGIDQIRAEAESSVSLMTFQSVSTFGRDSEFSYDPTLNRVLSLYTVKGRAAYCTIDGFGGIECFN